MHRTAGLREERRDPSTPAPHLSIRTAGFVERYRLRNWKPPPDGPDLLDRPPRRSLLASPLRCGKFERRTRQTRERGQMRLMAWAIRDWRSQSQCLYSPVQNEKVVPKSASHAQSAG